MSSTGAIEGIDVGRDMTGGSVDAMSIGSLSVGRDMSTSVTATQNIGQVAVGRTLSGQITAAQGSIQSVDAGDNWGGYDTKAGNINGSTISAGTYVGDVTAAASPGFTGAMTNVTITANNGSIEDIQATSGMTTVTATASGSIGDISTTTGSITGSFTATNGSIGSVQATYGSLSAPLTAGTTIGSVTVQNDIDKAIHAGGTIGDVTSTTGSISGDITSTSGNIGEVLADTGISGKITATTGNIASVQSWGGITKDIFAGGTLGEVWAFGDISGKINSGAGKVEITAWGDLSGNVQVAGDLVVSVDGDVSGTLTSTNGAVDLAVVGKIIADVTSFGNLVVWASGDITSNLTSQHANLTANSEQNITGGKLIAALNVDVWTDGILTSTMKSNSPVGNMIDEEWDDYYSQGPDDASVEEYYEHILNNLPSENSQPELMLALWNTTLPPQPPIYTEPGKKTGNPANPDYDYGRYLDTKSKADITGKQGLSISSYWSAQSELWYKQYLYNKSGAKTFFGTPTLLLGKFTVTRDASVPYGASIGGFDVDYTPDPSMALMHIKLVQAIRNDGGGPASHFDENYYLTHPAVSSTGKYPLGYAQDVKLMGKALGVLLPSSKTGGYQDAPVAGPLGDWSSIEVAAVRTDKSGQQIIISMVHFRWNAITGAITPPVQTPLPDASFGVWTDAETEWTSAAHGGITDLHFYPK